MSFSLDSQQKAARVGNLYGWALGFLDKGWDSEQAAFLLTSMDYYATIEATLAEGLSGGRLQIVLESLSDSDYRRVRASAAVDLYLFWQDANADFLTSLAGSFGLQGFAPPPSTEELQPALVGRFSFAAKRRVGKGRYETVLEGGDHAFHLLSATPAPRQPFDNLAALLSALGAGAHVSIRPEPGANTLVGQQLAPEDERSEAASPRATCADALRTVAARIAGGSRQNPEIQALKSSAPAVIVLRDGAVHVGRYRIPLGDGATAKPLDATTGLVEAGRESSSVAQGAGPLAAGAGSQSRWTLLCRGRADLKPGDLVQFKKPPEDVESALPDLATAFLGSLAGPWPGAAPEEPDCNLLVTSVTHKLGRSSGFSSELSGIELPMPLPADPWATFHTASGLEEASERRLGTGGGDPAVAIARQVGDLARAAVGRLRLPEVAEVRAAVSRAGNPPEPPAQTVTVWEGTGGASAHPNASRRLAIRRDTPIERQGAGTVTPFAWGACGLAVPRYPGMRVVLGYANGKADDPLDLGALWGPGERMECEPGDWWLKLPTDASTEPLRDTADHLPSGKVVNDLTDAAGVRVIEVGKLTLRVGEAPDIGARPEHRANEAISIEHSDGKASIRMDQDGKITISGADITIDAGANGTVTIRAKGVAVSVGDKMTVGS